MKSHSLTVGALVVLAGAATWVPPVRAEPGGTGVDAGTTLNAVGPPLTALRTKVADPNWLIAWLLKPSRLRSGTIMPDADMTPAEVQAAVAYLYAAGAPAKETVRWQGGDARIGEQLFVTRGCRGCHAIQPTEHSVSNRVPNLAGIGLKVRGEWLFRWLKSPRTYNPSTPMPQLLLTDEEVRHLVAFLLSHKEGADVVAAAPRFTAGGVAAGRAVVERYDCGKCHVLNRAPLPAPAFELASDAASDAPLRNGRALVAYYNCRGCHRIEGSGGAIAAYLERKAFAPPTLEGEGRRVQPSWLAHFLHQPTPLRPWLQIRMPNYGFSDAEVAALGEYFAALGGVAATDEPLPTVAEETTARGLRRFAHFKCVQCHPTTVGPQLPDGVDPENLSINLTLAKTRLRPSWIREFLAKPKAIVGMQTRMPSVFYSTDGDAKVEQPDRDIEAIAAYVLRMTEPPEVTLAKLNAEKVEQPATDWTKVEY